MALLHRLFSSKKNQKDVVTNLDKSRNYSWEPFDFNRDQVRILLFRECEWRGRKLLFDSKAVNRIKLENHKQGLKKSDSSTRLENFVEVTDGYGYQYIKPSSDTIQLGEMVFGSVAMSFQGSTLKVHQLKSPTRVMCTKVFSTVSRYPYNGNLSERNLEDSFGSSIHSMNEYISSNGGSSNSKLGTSKGSGPVDVPVCNLQGKSTGGSLEIDSGIYGNASLQSSSSVSSDNNFNYGSLTTHPNCVYSRQNSGSFISHASGCSEGSFGCLQRRWSHTLNMSLEHCTNSSSCSENTSNSYKHNTKLGLAVLITFGGDERDMEIFLFEHMILVENIVERLRCSVEQAYIRKEMFVHLMMEGVEKLQQWLEDLFSAPRLENPLWLKLTSSPKAETSALVLSFIEDLCYLVANMDTKDTNFFISTLLTAVLTHHLGWVSTVLPEKIMPLRRCKEPCTSKLLKALALSHPYNPLWAQLGDLCGALGHPTKIARTIVTGEGGKKVDLLNKILTSLTYFIRCGEISKNISSRCSKEREDNLLKSSFVQVLPSAKKLTNGPLSTLVIDVSSELSENSTLHKSNKDFTSTPTEVVQSVPVSLSECENDLEANSDEVSLKKVGSVNGRINSSTNIETNCARLIRQVENLEVHDHDLIQNFCSKNFSEKLLPKVELPKTALINFSGDNFLCTSNCNIETHSENLKNLSGNHHINSPIPALSSESKSIDTSFQCGEVKYPDLSVDSSTELGNYGKSLNENAHKSVLDGESTCSMENSRKYTGGMKRTSSVLSNLSTTSSVSDINNAPVLPSVGVQKEYSKIYPSLAELLLLERGSGLIIEETNNLEQEVNSGFLHCSHAQFSRNTTSQVYSGKNNGKIASESHLRKKPTVAALSKFDTYVPKKVESERQISSTEKHFDKFGSSQTVHSCINRFAEPAADKSLESSGIVFLIGDEKLVGLRDSVQSGLEDSCSTRCESDCNFAKNTVNLNSMKNSLSVCESCKTNETSNVWHCKCSVGTTKVPDNCLHEKDKTLCMQQDFRKPFRFKTDSCNLTVSSTCVEVESENAISEKNLCLEMPYLSKCASSRSLNGLSKQKYVELCPSKSFSGKCKHLNNFTSDASNLLICAKHEGCERKRTLQENLNPIDSANNEIFSKLSEELRTKHIHPCNCFLSANENLVTDSSVITSECFKCVTSVSSSSCDVSSCHTSRENFTTEESERGKVPSFQSAESQPSFFELPLLESVAESPSHKFPLGLAFSLLGATCDHYVSDLILQGCTQNIEDWQMTLRKDLSFVAHHMFLDQEVSEALCIVGNTDTWEVQLVSSHTYVVDKPGMFGVRVGMSQLVANMLESLLNLWKMHTPPEHCLLYLESKLREVCLRSQALAELLLKTDFCDMEKLTVNLDLEANDVPLLLAVASTHTPQVTQRYGLCFH